MGNNQGTLTFSGVNPTRSMLRYVERQMEKWIERGKALGTIPPMGAQQEEIEYRVDIEREQVYPFYTCSVELKVGSRVSRIRECGRTLHGALSHALRRLIPENASPAPAPFVPRVAVSSVA